MKTRMAMKKQAETQKAMINTAFEKMKAKGKMDPNIMSKLGISTNYMTSADGGNRQSVRSMGIDRSFSPNMASSQKGSVTNIPGSMRGT